MRKKNHVDPGKKELYIQGAAYLALLIIMLIAIGMRLNEAYRVDQRSKITTEKLVEANTLYDNGDYYDALQIYKTLVKNYWSIDRANSCRYLLGKEAMESEDWTGPKAYFSEITVSDYEDSDELIKICNEELEKAESAA